MSSHRFDEDTRVERLAAGRYRGTLPDTWTIGPVVNGGYLLATLAGAACQETPHSDLLNASAYFLGPANPGPADVEVEVIKHGRTTSVLSARLLQGGRERVRALLLTSDRAAATGRTWHATGPPELPAPEVCRRLGPGATPAPRLMQQVDLRFDPATAAFTRGERDAEPTFRAWLRFADGREPDVRSLLLFADVLPPTSFNLTGVTGWVPTLEITVQVRRRPAPGWLRVAVTTRHLTDGHFEEDGELWDSEDRLVALVRQRAMVLGD